MSPHFTTLSRHKELKMVEKLCRDKRRLCHDTKSIVNFEGQEDSVITEKFSVTIENSKRLDKSRQCACDKALYDAIDISIYDKAKVDYMLQ